MLDKVVKLVALVLLAMFVYFHAQQAEVGRFQIWANNPVLIDTRTGRVYVWNRDGALRIADVKDKWREEQRRNRRAAWEAEQPPLDVQPLPSPSR